MPSEASPIVDQNTAFGEDAQRGYKQTAFFGSLNFDLIPKVLTVSGGTRWYKYQEFEEGSEWYSESTSSGYVLNHANGVCLQKGLCGFPINLYKSETRHPQPPQPHLAHHSRHDGVLHLLAGFPSGWLQPY